jgi:hypothetical protein
VRGKGAPEFHLLSNLTRDSWLMVPAWNRFPFAESESNYAFEAFLAIGAKLAGI